MDWTSGERGDQAGVRHANTARGLVDPVKVVQIRLNLCGYKMDQDTKKLKWRTGVLPVGVLKALLR